MARRTRRHLLVHRLVEEYPDMSAGERPRESGAALLIVLMTASLVAALALAAIVVSETEQRIEASFEWTMQARAAAEMGATRVVADLAGVIDWTSTLSGASL